MNKNELTDTKSTSYIFSNILNTINQRPSTLESSISSTTLQYVLIGPMISGRGCVPFGFPKSVKAEWPSGTVNIIT